MTNVMKISDVVMKLTELEDITGDLPVYGNLGGSDFPYFDMAMHVDFEKKVLVIGSWAKPEDDES